MAETETDGYREQAEATIADLRARVSHYEAVVVAVRERTLQNAADALEAQPPKTHAQYVATLRLYAAEPWRLSIPPSSTGGSDRG